MREHDLAVVMDKYGLEIGTPGIKSIGPLAFGPEESCSSETTWGRQSSP